jgi:hypothetical protein
VTRSSPLMYASAAALSYLLTVPLAAAQQPVSSSPASSAPAAQSAVVAAPPAQAQSTVVAAQPAQAQSAQPAAQAAPRVPLPNRVNSTLPSWLRLRGEFRERWEGFDGLGFNETREDHYWLSRLRLNAGVTPSKSLSFQVQVQDARVGKKEVPPTSAAPFRAPFDLRMGYVDIGASTGPVTVRGGRQELAYGDQRLVGHVSWLNSARTFDGGKLTLRSKGLQVDGFVTSVVRIMQDEFDKSGAGNVFAGAYLTSALIPKGSFEPYVFYRGDQNIVGELGVVDNLQSTTLGFRSIGKLPASLDYNVEMALQRGDLGSNDVTAWAGHWQLRETVSSAWTPKVIGEYNYASGDRDPGDGKRQTFDQLYPTPHDKYGLADQVGWKNIHHVRAGVEVTPLKGMPVTANYHSWWLAESRDALYNVASTPIARVAGGAANSHVGQEIDVQVSKAIFPQLQLAAGYAHIFTGAFLKEATPGASYSHPYVSATYIFLADK